MRKRHEEGIMSQIRTRSRFGFLVPAIYIVFLVLPIYWLVNMSFKINSEILGALSFWP
jgi:glycerol transport system permease protein